MTLDPNYNQLNLESTKRIKKLVANLKEEQFQIRVGEHWTVTMAFVHLAFWDRRILYALDKTEQNGKLYIPEVEVAVNDISLPIWATVPAKESVRLVIESCEELDIRLENFPQHLIEEMYNYNKRWVVRALHRNEHLDEVEEALKK